MFLVVMTGGRPGERAARRAGWEPVVWRGSHGAGARRVVVCGWGLC